MSAQLTTSTSRNPSTDHSQAERLRRELVVAFRVFHKRGYDEGIAGHMTVRDPDSSDHFWVNPEGVGFDEIQPEDLILVDHEGRKKRGDGEVNESAFLIHSRVHVARPDVACAMHAHSLYARTWATLGRLLDPITQNAAVFYEDHVLVDAYLGPVLDAEYAEMIAEKLGTAKAAILLNHGLLTVGRSVSEAAWWFCNFDQCCKSQLLAEAVGTPIHIDRDVAAATAQIVGTPEAGHRAFQPALRTVVAREPHLDPLAC